MTPQHEAELHEAGRNNAILKMLVNLRYDEAFIAQPMTDEDFYHMALLMMTEVASAYQKSADGNSMRSNYGKCDPARDVPLV